MTREKPTASEIKDALEGEGGPGNGEYYSDVLRNATPENRKKAQRGLEESESNR